MGSEHWTTIGKISEVYDGPHATPKKTDEGPYFLSISSLENGQLDLSKSVHISEKDFQKWTKRVTPEAGDLLFSYETRLGEAALMPPNIKGCLGRRMGLLRPKRDLVSPQYLLYAYLSPGFQDQIKIRTVYGSTVNRIPLREFAEFPIRIPPIHEQRAIAHILGSLDDKIDLLRRMNETLEQMAQALFQSWFVEEKRASLREITLGDLVDIDTGFAFKSKFYQDEGELKVIRGKNVTLGTIRWGSDAKYWPESTEGLERYFLSRLDIVIGMDGSRVGRNRSLVLQSDLPSILAQRVARVRAKNPALQPLIWRFINSKAFERYVELIKTGTSIPHISLSQIASFDIRVHSLEEMTRFSQSASSFIDKQEANLEQIQTLTSLRDTLLPKLISGELRVGEAAETINQQAP